jgi:hypothetical protein
VRGIDCRESIHEVEALRALHVAPEIIEDANEEGESLHEKFL